MTNVKDYTDTELLNHAKTINGFKGFPKNKWIYSVRSSEDAENTPDDKHYIFESDKFITMLTGSTNPGAPVLKGGFLRYNKTGAAVVKSDEWYHDVWQYGLHMGRMRALRQVNPIIVFRDGDRDGKSEEIGKPIKGLFGINFHGMDYNVLSKVTKTQIGEWSAGCFICNNMEKYYQTIGSFEKNGLTTLLCVKEF